VISSQPNGLPVPTQPPLPTVWTESKKTVYPNPRGSPDKCNSPGPSYICDPNLVLSIDNVTKINNLLLELRKRSFPGHSTCLCGNNPPCQNYTGLPIAIAVMSDFEAGDRQRDVMSSFAELFFTNWQFQTCTDGIIYVIGANSTVKVIRKLGDTVWENIKANMTAECIKHIESNKLLQATTLTEAIVKELDLISRFIDGTKKCTTATASGATTLTSLTVINYVTVSLFFLVLPRNGKF